jgi:hypothetical protein
VGARVRPGVGVWGGGHQLLCGFCVGAQGRPHSPVMVPEATEAELVMSEGDSPLVKSKGGVQGEKSQL